MLTRANVHYMYDGETEPASMESAQAHTYAHANAQAKHTHTRISLLEKYKINKSLWCLNECIKSIRRILFSGNFGHRV